MTIADQLAALDAAAYATVAHLDDRPVGVTVSAHDEVKPGTWDEFVGQDRAKLRLQVEAQSAKVSGRRPEHTFLYGPGGSGKTTLAGLVAAEIGAPLAVVTTPADERQLARVLWDQDISEAQAGILFVDELHRWTKRQQDGLLTLLEQQFIDIRFARYYFPQLTVIAGTTERRDLRKTILSRFAINLRFDPYTPGEMAQIVAGMAGKLEVELDDATVVALAGASNGVPRIARHLVSAARTLADTDTEPTASMVFAFTRIHPDGLTDEHVAYLQVLDDCTGQAGADVLSSRLDVSAAELRDLERLLSERKFIGLGGPGVGRLLTPAGRRRLGATHSLQEVS